jgi:D-arginine dehydrogenase
VVNAAGAWAAALGREAGGLDLPLVNYRRHLFYTGELAGVNPDDPWVWDVERGFYVRPESQGLLLCACDQDPRPPEDTQVAPGACDLLAGKAESLAPALGELPLARHWAGLRGFLPDDRFAIGLDPVLGGLLWVTALGGHGLTTCAAVGELAARALDGVDDPLLEELAPARTLALNPGASA